MPRFYFDMLREGDSFTRDDDGLEFVNLDEAAAEAANSAAELGRDRLPKGHAPEIMVEVRDEHGERVLTVTARLRSSLAPTSIRCSSSPHAMLISTPPGWNAIWRWRTRLGPPR